MATPDRVQKLEKWIASVQGVLYVATGIWPVLHIASFLFVTGPKQDLWLVQTFGLVLAAVGGALLYMVERAQLESARCLGIALSLALTAADVVFVAKGIISPVYLLDAAAEVALAAAWTLAWLLPLRRSTERRRWAHAR